VVILADELGGGTGTILLSVSKRWDPKLWHASILSQREPRARVAPGVPVEVLPAPGAPSFYPVGQLRRLRQIATRVRRERPAIVHSYFFWSIMYGRALKALGLVPRLVENREDQGFNWGRHEYSLLRLTANLPDRIICVSEAVRQTVLEREGHVPSRVTVIHNGIDIDTSLAAPSAGPRGLPSLRRTLGLAEGDLVVGMVANFNRAVKGVGYFFDAMPMVLAEVPAARFLLLGRGDEEVHLRARAEAMGIADRVIFAGFQPEIGPYYDLMDISVLTSLSEGLSMTVLESMKHGVPVVATRVGGNPELVADGGTGYLVPARDVSAFAERVVELLRDPSRRVRMGREGRRVVEERFNIARTAELYTAAYRELLTGE
jgi:glycosyltransferase involved in cell wall biosynthesis